MKTFNTLRSVQEDYQGKQLGTGEPLDKPEGGQGRNRDDYEAKKRKAPADHGKKGK
jgi:hypothetical protein